MRQVGRLNPRQVGAITEPGRHADGNNLYLSVSANGGRRWVFMYRRAGRQVEIGLGSARTVPLAKARLLAKAAHEAIADGRDPRSIRRPAGNVMTFGDAADALIDALRDGWRNEKHEAQWRMTLGRVRDAEGRLTDAGYCLALRDRPVAAVGTEDVLAVLRPIWTTKPETAARVRSRIERVLDAARAQGWRTGENPARWRGHLDHLLAARQRLSRGHHAALPYADVPAFVADLRGRQAVAASALEFVILTAARTGEALGATWAEVDFAAKVWTVPAARMKSGREHRVPLSDRAVAILRTLEKAPARSGATAGASGTDIGERIFPLSTMALAMLLRRMGRDTITVHGFRSAFRDWAGDSTTFPREVAEAALAHVISDKTEAAYRRADALDRRRKLMDAWARYCEKPASAKVIELRSAV